MTPANDTMSPGIASGFRQNIKNIVIKERLSEEKAAVKTMKPYAIITDSGCDVSADTLARWQVGMVNMTFHFDGDDKEYTNQDMSAADFYRKMREGAAARTAAANVGDFAEVFEKELANGSDVLYIAFSSGLSTTYAASEIAARDLREKYPERTIVTLDSKCASGGEGLLVYLAVLKRDGGMPIEENAACLRENIPHLCHWFTVDDLKYLRRGGRISATTAVAGTVLGIKPVLHVDDEGHLVNVEKARGRKQSLRAIAEKYEALAEPGTPVFVSHADSPADAAALGVMIEEKSGKPVDLVTDIGAVIGAHSGPGTLALFFLGKRR